MRQFQGEGIELATGKLVQYKLRAVDAHAVRAQAKLDGIEVRELKEVKPPSLPRDLRLKELREIGCLVAPLGLFVAIMMLGLYGIVQDRISAHHAKAAQEHLDAERYGPHWRQAMEYAGQLANERNSSSLMRKGWLWYVDEKATPSYDQKTGEYTVSVYSYGPGANPINGTSRQFGWVVLKGAPGSWTIVSFH